MLFEDLLYSVLGPKKPGQAGPAQQQFIPSVSSRLETQFLTPFTIRKCCVGNTKANEDFGEAWMFIIALVTLCLKMGITLRSFPRDSAQRRISLESHAKYLAAGGLQLHPIFPLLPLLLKLTVLPQTGRVLQGWHGRLPGNW